MGQRYEQFIEKEMEGPQTAAYTTENWKEAHSHT